MNVFRIRQASLHRNFWHLGAVAPPVVKSNRNIPKPVKVEEGKVYKWCSCGQTNTQPFCDGSHRGSGFSSIKWTAPKTEKALLCCCKNTHNPPYCDMTHFKVLGGGIFERFRKLELQKNTDKPLVAGRLPIYQHLKEGKTYLWCACGRSQEQPFCDGSHECTEIKPLSFTPEKTKSRWLCTCKQTKNAPFCDASHLDVEVQTATEGHAL